MESRKIEIDENATEVEISQNLQFGYAGEVWDAALVFSHFIINKHNRHNFSFVGKTILELGSGTGICGLMAAIKNAKKVYLTDKEENLDILKKNYELNKHLITLTEVVITSLNWTKPEEYAHITDKIDMIICSDIVWDLKLYDSIINVMDYFTEVNTTEILLSYQYRKQTDIEFFNELKAEGKWQVERIPDSVLDEEYRSDDIFLVRISKLK
jgi:predicted nicotinamide N-methyase